MTLASAKKVFHWKSAFICLLGATLTFAVYQHFWARRIQAQSTATTRILIPWINGDDAGYTFLLTVYNTTTDPYGSTPTSGTCTADAYQNGVDYSGSLGTFPAGSLTTLTETQVQTAIGLTLANSGQRAYLFLTCTFPYAHAEGIEVNPGGVVTWIPGYIIPPNRSLNTGPEQLAY